MIALAQRIIDEGYSAEYGARPLRQVITHYIDDTLSDAILSGKLRPGCVALCDVDDDGKVTVRDPARQAEEERLKAKDRDSALVTASGSSGSGSDDDIIMSGLGGTTVLHPGSGNKGRRSEETYASRRRGTSSQQRDL